MMLAFIMYMTLRNATHQKDMVEVGAWWGWVRVGLDSWPSQERICREGKKGQTRGARRWSGCQTLGLGLTYP